MRDKGGATITEGGNPVEGAAGPAVEELEADGRAGEPIDLPLALGPATGYAWRLELPPGVVQVEHGPERQVDDARRLGGAVGGALRVTAPSGEHVLAARLARPWEPEEPVRLVRIRLHVR